jgi:hypothetical protein
MFAGAINKTAHAIQVKPRQSSPPPTLRDHMNEHVGDKMFDTDNLFQQERLTGMVQSSQDKFLVGQVCTAS